MVEEKGSIIEQGLCLKSIEETRDKRENETLDTVRTYLIVIIPFLLVSTLINFTYRDIVLFIIAIIIRGSAGFYYNTSEDSRDHTKKPRIEFSGAKRLCVHLLTSEFINLTNLSIVPNKRVLDLIEIIMTPFKFLITISL